MVYYKLVKITIDVASLMEVIINVIVTHHGFPKSIISDKSYLFSFKFLFSIYYFLNIKQKFFTTFYF